MDDCNGRTKPLVVKSLSGFSVARQVPAQRVAHCVLIPPGRVQQPLHPDRLRVPGELRQRPPVLALHPRHQAKKIGMRPQPRLPPEKSRGHHWREHVIKPAQPPGRVNLPSAWRHGRNTISKNSHTPMITKRPSSRHATTPTILTKCSCLIRRPESLER